MEGNRMRNAIFRVAMEIVENLSSINRLKSYFHVIIESIKGDHKIFWNLLSLYVYKRIIVYRH